MKHLHFIVIATLVVLTSCTLEKTDYEAELNVETTEYIEFEEVTSIISGDYTISIEALNGTLYKGYNEVHLKINNTLTDEFLDSSKVTLLPIMTDANGNKVSCPHADNLTYNTTEAYYLGYIVFTNQSSSTADWQLYIDFTDSDTTHAQNQIIVVEEQVNKNLNMTAFTGNDNEQYFIALVAPQSPGVAQNDLLAGIYKYNKPTTTAGIFPDPSQFSYSIVAAHTLLIDPRMPESSMGNHSSPNNQDLEQQTDGLYHGIVNYTMTGNWTLNFILKNENDVIIKGTEVSTEFTPGIEGEKGELFIDILF
jgi:negative regulator of genetic competence, sporulation and motility